MELPHDTPLDPGIVAAVFEPAGDPHGIVAFVMRAVHVPVAAMADENRVMPMAVSVMERQWLCRVNDW